MKNYLKFPKNQTSKQNKEFPPCKYLYFLACFPLGGLNAFNIEIKSQGKLYNLSFSSLFKQCKKIPNLSEPLSSSNSLQIPLKLTNNHWTILIIDLESYIKSYFDISAEWRLHSIKLCANLIIKTIISSDRLFNLETFPQEIQFRLNKGENFLDVYNYILLSEDPPKENIFQKTQKQENIDKTKFNGGKPISSKELPLDERKGNISTKLTHKKSKSLNKKVSFNLPPVFESPPIRKYGFNDDLQRKEPPKPFSHPSEMGLCGQMSFELTPTPIMTLQHLHGYSGLTHTLKKLNNSQIIYSIGPNAVLYDINTQKQSYFIGQTEKIRVLCHCHINKLLITAGNSDVYLWDMTTCERLPGKLQTGLKLIKTMEIGYEDLNINQKKTNKTTQIRLFITGEDEKSRVSIQIYETDPQTKALQLFHKQLSDWEITKFRLIDPKDSSLGFITLGSRNLRLWKIKTQPHLILIGANIPIDLTDPSLILTDAKVLNNQKEANNEQNLSNITKDSTLYVSKDNLNNNKIMVSASNGFLYIIDNESKQTLAGYKLGNSAIVSLSYDEASGLIASGFNDSRLMVWRADFSQSILEGRLESQSNIIEFLSGGRLLCGCLNGSIGMITIQDQKFRTLIRSHTDEILQIDYNKALKKIITISKDCTIRVWGVKSNGIIEETYEFRCLDEEIVKLKSFSNLPWIVCGFFKGLLRVFDLNNYSAVWESTNRKNEITSLEISKDDNMLLVIDKIKRNMLLYLQTGSSFQEIKEIPLKSLEKDEQAEHRCYAGFDKLGVFFYIVNNSGYCLEIYSMKSFEKIMILGLETQISQVIFSRIQHHVFIIHKNGLFSRYILRNNEDLSLHREYPSLHKGEIFQWDISKNSKYVLSLGEDNFIKVWDYALRGYLTPYYQCFQAGEALGQVIFSNDNQNMVFGYGKESMGLYVWRFMRELDEEDDEVIDDYGLIEGGINGEKEVFEMDLKKRTNFGYEAKTAIPLKEITNNNENYKNMTIGGDVMGDNLRFNENMMENRNKISTENNNFAVENYNKSLINRNEYNKAGEDSKDNAENNNVYKNKKYEEFGQKEEVKLNIPLLGRHLSWNSQIGFNTKLPKNTTISNNTPLIWAQLHNYFAYISFNHVIITYLQSPKAQKKLTFDSEISHILLTPSQQTLIVILVPLEILLFSAKTLIKQGNCTSTNPKCLLSVSISPCNTYLLTLEGINSEESPLVNIWEIGSAALITCSIIKEIKANFSEISAKWSPLMNNLEFYLFSAKTLQVWRLTSKRSLEYQNLSLPKHEETLQKYGFFSSLEFIELKNENNSELMVIIGTSMGSLLIIDSRSGALLCILASVIKSPVIAISINSDRMIVRSNNQNIYHWKLAEIKSLETLAEILQNPAETLALDSVILGMSPLNKSNNNSNYDGNYMNNQMMAITKTGILWLLDYDELTTIKLMGSHLSDKSIISTVVFEDPYLKKLMIFSASKDGSIKIWDFESLELLFELLNPRKECLCIDINNELGLLISGFSDGTIGFYDYRHSVSKGFSKIETNENCSKGVFSIKTLQKSINNLLISLGNGDIYMGYIEIINGKIKLDFGLMVKGLDFPMIKLSINEEDELNEWAMMDLQGKITVWNRKDLSRIVKTAIIDVQGVEVYLIDSYKPSNSNEKIAKSNKFDLKFLKREKDAYMSISPNGFNVWIRNYREHVNIKVIELKIPANCLALSENETFLYLGGDQGVISMFDFNIGLEIDRLESVGKEPISSIYLWEGRKKTMIELEEGEKEIKPFIIAAETNNLTIFNIV